MILRKRLFFVDVQNGSCDLLPAQRFEQGSFIHSGSATDVDDEGMRRQGGEQIRVDDLVRVFGVGEDVDEVIKSFCKFKQVVAVIILVHVRTCFA